MDINSRYQAMLSRRNGGDPVAMAREDAAFSERVNSLSRRPEPTPGQAEAGNYKKRKLQWHGLTISIENEVGSIRKGHGWQTRMVNAYGYINRTEAVDGDEVDVYLGPDESADTVYVVHQRRFGDWERYDEDKAMLNFSSEADAKAAYLKHYDDPRFLGPITAMPVAEFVEKAKATKDAPKMIKSIILIFPSGNEHELSADMFSFSEESPLKAMEFENDDASRYGMPADFGNGSISLYGEGRASDGYGLYGVAGQGREARVRDNLHSADQQICENSPFGMGSEERSDTGGKSGDTSLMRQPCLRKSGPSIYRDTDGQLQGHIGSRQDESRGVGGALQSQAGQDEGSDYSGSAKGGGELRQPWPGVRGGSGSDFENLYREGLAGTLYKALEAGQRFITIHPNGPGTKGQPVLVQESGHGSGVYHVIGGAGGKLNMLKLRGIKPESSYKEHAAEKSKAKREQKKVARARDKELGLDKGKTQARESVKMQQTQADKAFIKTVADKMGWKPEELEPNIPETISEVAQNRLAQKHHSELLKRANEAVDLQQQNLMTDVQAREEAGVALIPDEHTPPEQLTVADLDDARPQAKSSIGFAAHYAERAAENGAPEEAIKQEATEKKESRRAEMTDNQRAAIQARGDKASQIKAEMEAIREPITSNIKAVLVDSKDAVDLIKARKKWKALQKAVQAANKDIDESVEVKAYNIEVSAPDDSEIESGIENDLRTIRTRAFLAAVDKETSNPEKELRQHIGAGAFNSINALALTAGGNALVDRSVVDVLGIDGAAQVLARRLHADLPADEMEKLTAGMEDWHVHRHMEASKDAMQEAQSLQDAAKEISLGEASHGDDFEACREINRRKKDAIEQSHKILGTALGEMEANAALVFALKGGRSDKSLEVPMGKIADEDAIRQARAIGLQRGDYSIDKVGGNQVLTVTPEGMDRLSKPVDRDEMERTRNTLDILNGGQDEDDWLPQGFAKRPDLALDLKPGVAATLAKPFVPSGDMQQSLKDYIGGRAADGDSPADIVADIQSSDFFQKSGDNDAYREALDAVAPLKGKDGKMARAESLSDAFNEYADSFVQREYGGKISTLQRQQFEPDHVAQDALHRALSDEPAGIVAYKPIGELTNDDQRALREHFYAHVAKEDPQAAALRERLDGMAAHEPEKESVDMFGDTSINPEWGDWKAQRDTLAEEVNSASLDWQKYAGAMHGHEKAYAAIQDMIRSTVGKSFSEHYNKLNPSAPLKLGRQVIRGNQSQMGFFSTEQEPDMFGDAPKVEKPLGADERHTLGHAAERTIAAMMPVVGKNFKPGQPLKLFNPTMSGPDGVMRQRAIKIIEANKRVALAAGTGAGKTAMMLGAYSHLQSQGKAKRGMILCPSIVQGQMGAEANRFMEPGKYNWHCEPGASREERIAAYKNPDHHFTVMTHQSFRDDMLHLGAKHAGIDQATMSANLDAMAPEQRSEWMKGVMAKEGINYDFCLPGDSLVTLSDWSTKTIKEIVESEYSGSVLSINLDTMEIESREITGWQTIQCVEESLVEVSTSKGVFRCTADHKVWTGRGYVNAGNILVGDVLVFVEYDMHNTLSEDGKYVDTQHAYWDDPRGRIHQQAAKQISKDTNPAFNSASGICDAQVRTSFSDLSERTKDGEERRLWGRVFDFSNKLFGLAFRVPRNDMEGREAVHWRWSDKTSNPGGSGLLVHGRREYFRRGLFNKLLSVYKRGSGESQRLFTTNVWDSIKGAVGFKSRTVADKNENVSIRRVLQSDWQACNPELAIQAIQSGAGILRIRERRDFRKSLLNLRNSVCAWIGLRFACMQNRDYEAAKQRLVRKEQGRNFQSNRDTASGIDRGKGLRNLRERILAEAIDGKGLLKRVQCGDAEKNGACSILRSKGFEATVLEVRFVDGPPIVYDITVADNHNFFADGHLVSNCATDEAHNTLNRAGKDNSAMANVIDSLSSNTQFFISATADVVKNDISEAADVMRKMDPKRYADTGAFMRRYGVDTAGSKDALKRELIRHVLPFKIEPKVRADKKEIKVTPSESQNTALADLDKNLGKVRIARMAGKVDVEAMKAISPGQFKDKPEAEHEAIAKELSASLGIIKGSAVRSILDSSPGSAKIDALSKIASERKGKPGVVFAHSLDAVENIKKRLEADGHRVVTLTGADSSEDKAAKIRGFSPDKGESSHDIIVCSDAGATGANLQKGQYVAQFDTPHTAMTWQQRRGRCFRIGQTKDVELIDLIADHPSETRARERLKNKDALRELMSSQMEGLDDSGLAAFLHERKIYQEADRLL